MKHVVNRSPRASTTIVELGTIAVLIVVVALFCLNVSVLVVATGSNDRACRDAARAAAQGDSYSNAVQLASAAIQSYRADGYFVQTPQLDLSSFTYQDFGGNPPANISPFVDVTTTCSVRIPAPILIYGIRSLNEGRITFRKSYRFPIIRTRLYS